MSNTNPVGEYIPFGIDIMTVNGISSTNSNAPKDIINSSQVSAEGGVNDGFGDGDGLFD